MISEVQNLLDDYVDWLKDRTKLREIGSEWVEVTTPYLDRHNDYLQVYAKKQGDSITMTDDGYTINDLMLSGCKLDSPKRQALLKMTLAGFGIAEKEGRLEVSATPETFAPRKHNLVQAMLAVNDLFYLAVPMVASLFYEDVVQWLDISDIRYTPNVKFTGKMGYDHLFDFVIPKSRKQPERILQTITRPSKETAEAAVLKWIDTREVRSPDSCAFAFLNDQEQRVSPAVLDALRNYEIEPVVWSERETARDKLAA
ncbi:MAG: DUF1829 domain-containing protein [Phycisphaeraceae bacterium]